MDNHTVADFLSPEISTTEEIARNQLSGPTWNMLIRALVRAEVIDGENVIDTVRVSDLSSISIRDVRDLRSVGQGRLIDFLDELGKMKFPAESMAGETLERIMQDSLTIEQQVLLNILTIKDWREEFSIAFGFDYDDSIFADESVARSIRVFELRVNGLTLDNIGLQFGVTRERIRQIVKKSFGLVSEHPSLGGRNFQTICNEKASTILGIEVKKRQEEKDLIDSLVRGELNVCPGLTIGELAKNLSVGLDDILQSIHPQTSKFIWTEARDNSNESLFSDSAIIDALKLAEVFESPVSAPMYRDLVERGLINGPGPQTVALRFGSWKEACEIAEISYYESVRTQYETQWTPDEMLGYVVSFLLNKSFGRGIQAYDEWRIETMSNAPSGAHVRKHFDTWIETKNKALIYMRDNDIKCNL